eukprot:TRINITY_DN10520_c0_g1_i1.p1 TRINITY_DN10520_c0_g1~~TRINITY_DN10520_c0_g1_i1.p1  ORF type:complete len:267 (-),score=53.36 TRINITY_DN10520_c0_g1_i1:227-1003(-)
MSSTVDHVPVAWADAGPSQGNRGKAPSLAWEDTGPKQSSKAPRLVRAAGNIALNLRSRSKRSGSRKMTKVSQFSGTSDSHQVDEDKVLRDLADIDQRNRFETNMRKNGVLEEHLFTLLGEMVNPKVKRFRSLTTDPFRKKSLTDMHKSVRNATDDMSKALRGSHIEQLKTGKRLQSDVQIRTIFRIDDSTTIEEQAQASQSEQDGVASLGTTGAVLNSLTLLGAMRDAAADRREDEHKMREARVSLQTLEGRYRATGR